MVTVDVHRGQLRARHFVPGKQPASHNCNLNAELEIWMSPWYLNGENGLGKYRFSFYCEACHNSDMQDFANLHTRERD